MNEHVAVLPVVSATTTTPSGYSNRSPYVILDISPSASGKDIKRKYYQLCLKYHPDKLQQLPKSQRQKYEQTFKDIQWAYSEISSGNCRQPTSFPFHFGDQRRSRTSSSPSTSSGNSWNDYYRSQFEQYRQQAANNRHRMYNFGNSNRGMSSPNTFPFFNSKLWSTGTHSTMADQGPKFLFREHITIPLSDLYTGQSQYRFKLSSNMNNIISRTIAAFRGGMGPYILYQSILYAIPILRFSRIVSIATVMYMFHQQLFLVPALESINDYLIADILPGYKGTTKLIFKSDIIQIPNMEVEIIIQEGRHPIYHRKNNDLYVTCTISKKEAKKGCTIQMSSLESKETNVKVVRHRRNQKTPGTEEHDAFHIVSVHVPPNTVSGDVIQVVGKGWPIRPKSRQTRSQLPNALLYGDLFVTIHVEQGKSASQVGPKWYDAFHVRRSKVKT
jgi:DnaJ-class molecular chaperone